MDNNNIEAAPLVEEEYEVERIVGHKIVKSKSTRKFKYFIKWLNYDESDNTWEKEEDVFAVDIIAQYWSNLPKTDKDRILFESLQSKKKNPIILSSPVPKVAKVISASSPSPPSSPILQATQITDEKPSTISYFNGKKKNERVVSKPSTSTTEDEITKGKEKVDVTLDQSRGIKRTSPEEEEEDKKRTRSGYTDYFTEQHKKRKRLSDNNASDEEEDNHNVVDDTADEDVIIFDEALENDPLRDWNELAVKVEYIGRELDGGPIYCAVKWKDDAVSLHSLDLVRKKRPDLVIDAFIKSVYNE